MPFDPDKPYNDLPLLPPKAELETKAVLRRSRLTKTLAELKGAGALRPTLLDVTLWAGRMICPSIGHIRGTHGFR